MPRLALPIVSCFGLLSCQSGPNFNAEGDWKSPIRFDTVQGRIHTDGDTVSVLLELAVTFQQQAFGLMTRPRLDSASGMLFQYPEIQDSTTGFWMYRTLVPLDIAFMDSTGQVVAVRSMEPCRSEIRLECTVYKPGAPYRSAMEVNQGFLSAHGVGIGSRLELLR
jgi:uncharacterized protein